jgi:CheY-like chemotaxis protein
MAPEAKRGRVLVVDDEPTIGKVLERILAEYAVTVVLDAHQALAALEKDTFDVVVCDLMLPKMSGMELYGVLRRDRPAMASRVVFLTGGGFTLPNRHFLSSVPSRHLKKPFEAAAVRRLVAEVLESHSSEGGRARITP